MLETGEERVLREARDGTLEERVSTARAMIGNMCAEGRCPKMSVPVRGTDEDQYISILLRDLMSVINDYSGVNARKLAEMMKDDSKMA